MKIRWRVKDNFLQIVQLALFFLVSLNIANLYFYLIFLAFFICVLANCKNFKIDSVFVILLLFSFSYILFYPPARGTYTTLLKQFSYPICYAIGLNLFPRKAQGGSAKQDVGRQIKLAILVVSMGAFLHYLLNAVTNFDSSSRNTVDYWTGDVLSATGQALLAIMALSVFSVWLIVDCPIRIKCLSLIGFVIIFAYNFVLAGRTILMLGAIIAIVAFIYNQKCAAKSGHMRTYLFLSTFILVLLVLFFNNAFGVRDWILNSNLANRFTSANALEDVRFKNKWKYVMHMFEFPWGGGEIQDIIGGYAHELYLDVYSDVGIFGYICVWTVVIISIVNVIKLMKSEVLSAEINNMLLCVFLGIMAVFMLEPILQGAPWLFCIFCFLSGVIQEARNFFAKNDRR